MSEPLRLRYVNQIVGAFLLGIGLLVLLLALLLIRAQGLFAAHELRFIRLTQSQLDGLREGTEVFLLGRRVGEVDGLAYADEFSEEGEPLIELRLKLMQSQIQMLQEGELDRASVSVQRKFGVGEPYLEIQRPGRADLAAETPDQAGGEGAKRFLQGFQAEEDPTDQVLRQLRSIEQSFSDTRDALVAASSDFAETSRTASTAIEEDVSPAVQSLKSASETLESDGAETLLKVRESAANFDLRINETSSAVQRFADGSAQEAASAVTSAAESTQRQVDQIGPQATAAMESLQSAARSLQTLSEESRQVVDVLRREAQDLPGTVSQVRGAVDGANEVIDSASQTWLLRRYINRYGPTKTVSPSAVRGPSFP